MLEVRNQPDRKLQRVLGEVAYSHQKTKIPPRNSGMSFADFHSRDSTQSVSSIRSSKLSRFFGDRPPDDMIMNQLEEFFPDYMGDDSTSEERKSILRDKVQSAILSKRMSRASVRQSTMIARVNRVSQLGAGGRASNKLNASISLADLKQRFDHDKTSKSEPESGLINWQKGSLIGQGGFGKVYHALNTETGEIMAVKQVLLGPETKSRLKKEEALRREIDLYKDLNHEHIVRYIGSDSTEMAFNVFLEYVSGGSISSCLQKNGKFEEELAQTIACQILYGLEYLHELNIIHRDIKGANGM